MRTWNIPPYRYDKDTTLGNLLGEFLASNAQDKANLVCALGTSGEQVDRWLASEFTVGLTSRYKTLFEGTTGIDLERLYVLEAKRSLLRRLEDLPALKQEKPGFWRLLTLDPELKRKIDLEAAPLTRNEVIESIQRLAKQAGAPLIGLQMGIDARVIDKWDTQGSWRPSDEMLERALAGLCMGLIAEDPDDTRFRVAAQALLGSGYEKIIGMVDLEAAARALFAGHETEPLSILQNRTGLDKSVIRGLLNYQPLGRRPMATMIAILRALLMRSHKDRLAEFDTLAATFVQNMKDGEITIEPMRFNTSPDSTTPAITPPLAPPRIAREDSTPTAQVAPQETPAEEDPVQDRVRCLGATLVATKYTLDAQLAAFRIQFPGIVSEDGRAAAPMGHSDGIQVLLGRGSEPLTRDETQRTVDFFFRALELAKMVCRLPEIQRSQLLHHLDPFLVGLQQTLEAAGTKEPEQYLQMLHAAREAGGLVR